MSAAVICLCMFPHTTFAVLRGEKPVFACQSVLSRESKVATIQKQGQTSTERKILSRVKVSPAQETEQQLRKKGFRDAYIAGMDEAHRMEAIADALRSNKVDPAVTHIEDFADQVEEHIAFFQRDTNREKEEIPALKKKVVDREAMEMLVRKARENVKNKEVTYNWWLQWNLKMLDTVSETRLTDFVEEYKHALKFKSPYKERFVEFLRIVEGYFQIGSFGLDDLVYFPTIKRLEIMAFNQVSSKKLVLLALFDRPAPADGLILHPIPFLLHDLQHSYNGRDLVDSFKYKVFHKLFKEKVKTLSTSQREKVELILYFYTREVSIDETSFDDFVKFVNTRWTGPHPRRLTTENDMKHLLPSFLHTTSKERVHEYFESAMVEFVKVAQEILKEQSEKQSKR